MAVAAALMLFTFALAFFGVGYGLVAVIRGRVRLTRKRTWVGSRARFGGVVCIGVSVAFWLLLVYLWSLIPG